MLQIGQTITIQDELYVEQCFKCQCFFAIPMDLRRRAKASRDVGFHCPNGHEQFYIKTETAKLKEEIESLNNRLNQKDSVIREKEFAIQQLHYSVRAQKSAKTKIINRVKNGVCPCCNRTFNDLQRHFKNKHPELFELSKT